MAGGGTSGHWLLALELFERGDPKFVDAVRSVADADALGAFAERWVTDPRPEARAMLFDYLGRPLNAYRHEPLVKRLFKLADSRGDDALMARFLVLFDRSVRRERGRKRHYEWKRVATREEADVLAAAWADQGFEKVLVWSAWPAGFWVRGWWAEPKVRCARDTTMPREETRDQTAWDAAAQRYRTYRVPGWVVRLRLDVRAFHNVRTVPDWARGRFARWRLFSLRTRYYLRRRAWRYFRRLGATYPDRYVPAVAEALALYRDEDVADGLALLDKWGLMHTLFHFSPALVANDHEWKVAPGRTLADLEPAPYYERLWAASPGVVVGLLVNPSACRPVRTWALKMIRRDPAGYLPALSLDQRLGLLADGDPEVVTFASGLVRDDPALADLPLRRWLSLAEAVNPVALEVVAEAMGRHVDPAHVSLAEAARLAAARPAPLARLGVRWLKGRILQDEGECETVLGLTEAGCEPLRPEVLRWCREALAASGLFRPAWVLRWLDSRHPDARAEGRAWFAAEPNARDDVTLWRALLETPYDDVRFWLVGEMEHRASSGGPPPFGQGLPEGDLLPLWAAVLLNVLRGHRAKPTVVRQIVRRVEARPGELPDLLPLLAVALRSSRGPEFRSGLAAVVRLAGRDPGAAGLVAASFPELRLE